MREPERIEPFDPRLASPQHRDRRGTPRHEAARRVHGDGLKSARGTAGAWIEHMTVAYAVHIDETLVVATGGDRARANGKRGARDTGLSRMTDADAPRLAPGLGAEDRQVARQVHEGALSAGLLQHECG